MENKCIVEGCTFREFDERTQARIDVLIAEAVDAEREACAKVCEVMANNALNTLAKVFHSGEEMEGEDGAVMVVDLALWNDGCEAIEALIGSEDEDA